MAGVNPRLSWTRPFLIVSIFVLAFNNLWNHSFIYADTFNLFAPHKFLIAEALRKGKIYAWYSWQKMGLPFVGDIIAGWFYPLNLLYLTLPFELAHRLFVFLHYPLAAIFMDLFLRKRGLDRYSSLLGGLAFSLSGYMVGQHGAVGVIIGPAWAPLALYFMDRALTGRIFWVFGVSGVLAIQIFAGEPQYAGITILLVSLMGIANALNPSWRRVSLSRVAMVWVFFILLSAAQWLPTYELLPFSTRSTGLPLNEAAMFSFHPGLIIELIWPDPFGRLWPNNLYWAKFAFNDITARTPWSISNYMGLPVFILAVIGALYSRRSWKIWVGVGLAVSLLLGMGRYTPLFPFLYRHVPFFNSFRFPAKYMALFSGFTAVAAALGLEQVQLWVEEKHDTLTKGAIIYIAGIVVTAVIAVFIWPLIISKVTGLVLPQKDFQVIKSYLFKTDLQWVTINFIVGLTLFFIVKRILPVRFGMMTFLFVLIVDFYLTNISTIPIGPPDIYDFQSIASKAITPGGRPLLGRYRIYSAPIVFRGADPAFQSYSFYERWAIWQRMTLFDNLHAMEGFEKVFGYNAIKFKSDESVFGKKDLGKRLELYNVEYVISSFYKYEPFENIKTETIYSDPQNEFIITRLPDVWPRAYWIPSAMIVPDDREAITLLNFSDLKKSVIITSNEKIISPNTSDRELNPITVTRYEPDHVTLESNEILPGWLVLSDRYYPGWNAFVDGIPVKIYKANILVRAIILKAGKHTIDFVYLPIALRIGVMVSMVSWTMMAIWLFIMYRNKSRAVL